MPAENQIIKIKNFIHGEWVEETGVETVPLINPSTGEKIGEVPLSSENLHKHANKRKRKQWKRPGLS